MANDVAILGRSTHVRGRVTGAASVEIAGRVDGEVDVSGDVTLESGGLCGANVSGRRLVIRGAVKGDLTGSESIALEDGAKVVGDVRAPRIAIAQGALLRGYVQTANGGSAPRAKSGATSRAAVPAARASTPRVVETKREPEKTKAALPPAAKSSGRAAGVRANAKAPPPPVVPALKKGAKGARRIGTLAGMAKKR